MPILVKRRTQCQQTILKFLEIPEGSTRSKDLPQKSLSNKLSFSVKKDQCHQFLSQF